MPKPMQTWPQDPGFSRVPCLPPTSPEQGILWGSLGDRSSKRRNQLSSQRHEAKYFSCRGFYFPPGLLVLSNLRRIPPWKG
jgi:hypothetical protein